jgi:Na+/proline symporter
MGLIVYGAIILHVVFIATFYNDFHDLKESKGTKKYPAVWRKSSLLGWLYCLLFSFIIGC